MDLLRSHPLSHQLADGIRRVGFRKWYEHELLTSHAQLILSVLSVVAMMASFEAFSSGGSIAERLMDFFFVFATGAIGFWSLRRYLFLLMRAEGVAHQASCSDCGVYGRFRVVGEDASHNETQVRCTRCEHLWTIST